KCSAGKRCRSKCVSCRKRGFWRERAVGSDKITQSIIAIIDFILRLGNLMISRFDNLMMKEPRFLRLFRCVALSNYQIVKLPNLLLFLVFSFSFFISQAQDFGTIKGALKNAKGKALDFVTITVKEQQELTTQSDEKGNYELKIPANR